LLVVLIKAVVLEGIEGNCGLQHIFEIHKTEQVLTPAHCGLLDEANTLETREGTENV